jgi:hypothetical protein
VGGRAQSRSGLDDAVLMKRNNIVSVANADDQSD